MTLVETTVEEQTADRWAELSQQVTKIEWAGVDLLQTDMVMNKFLKILREKHHIELAKPWANMLRKVGQVATRVATLRELPVTKAIVCSRCEDIHAAIEYARIHTNRELEDYRRDQLSLPAPKISPETFAVIYADPPWEYNFSKSTSREIENQYETETVERLKQIQIDAENAVLYLWATAPKLQEALEVMKAWGFEYKTHGVWNKITLGMGYWFRGIHELLLIGTKGAVSPPPENMRHPSVFTEKRTQHSKKPDLVYEWLEEWYPEAEKIELFARTTREGWQSFGDEL